MAAYNVQWVGSSYPTYPKYTYHSSSSMMMGPQPLGRDYYIPNGQYCSLYNQHVQQYQYTVATAPEGSYYGDSSAYGPVYATGYYTHYQPSVAYCMMDTYQQHQGSFAQLQATPTLPKRPRKLITIRDPNQGGRDVTQEILSGSNLETKPVQDLQSIPVASAPPVESQDGILVKTSFPAPSSLPAALPVLSSSVEAPVAEENKGCNDLNEAEPKDPQSNHLVSVIDSSLKEIPKVESESKVFLKGSPSSFSEMAALSELNGSVGVPMESEKEVETNNNDPTELIELSPAVNMGSVSNATADEQPSENASSATGKTDDEVKPNLVPSAPNISDTEQLQGCVSEDDEEKVKAIIDITVERATLEPNSAVMYANFCCELKEFRKLKVPNLEKMLLSRCQEEVKRERKNDRLFAKKQKEMNEATERVQQRLKKDLEKEKISAFQQSLNNMEFTAELFKLKLLPKRIINTWIEQKLVVNPSEDNVECLCRLLSLTGKHLHSDEDQYLMGLYFSAINQIIKQKKTSSRMCCMLQDIVDLRLNNWEPKSDNQGTKINNMVHNEIKQEDKKVPSRENINPKRETRKVQRQDNGLILVTIKNQTISTAHQIKNNKVQTNTTTLNHHQLDAPKKACSWENRGIKPKPSTEVEKYAYSRNYSRNDYCERDQDRFECWNRRDRRYRGQDMRPRHSV
ncbi:eukaryotic translation initiation factor 4 gamma 1-like isoform X2 [Trichomycterus rosablanca]|uniref:eukaryotic translation initiation factor 4 gamma 1-like isoform X2 n=1 Tax=Trichomycterus rosablanca TaxID=2290929 RepID=UPI002F360BBB